MEFSIAILVICLATLALSGVTGFVSIGLIINAAKKKAKESKIDALNKKLADYKSKMTTASNEMKAYWQEKIDDVNAELKSIK